MTTKTKTLDQKLEEAFKKFNKRNRKSTKIKATLKDQKQFNAFEEDALRLLSIVSRVEVIDKNGRSYVNYSGNRQEVSLSIQDEGRTLKVFIQQK